MRNTPRHAVTQNIFIWISGWLSLGLVEEGLRFTIGPLPPILIILFTLLLYSIMGVILGSIYGAIIVFIRPLFRSLKVPYSLTHSSMATCIATIIFLYALLFLLKVGLLENTRIVFLQSVMLFGLCIAVLFILPFFYQWMERKGNLSISYLSILPSLWIITSLILNRKNKLLPPFLQVTTASHVFILILGSILCFFIICFLLSISKRYLLKWRKIPFLKPALLGLLLIFLSFLLLRSESHHRFKYEMKNSPKDKPNVLLITLDTTRADHLSCYGYRRLTTPHLDKFSREGMLYKNAYATASWTLPSHASMFTGKYPTKHGAEYSGHSLYSGNILSKGQRDDRFDPEERARKFLKLPEDNLTLAEILSEKGYRTAGIIGGVFCSSIFGLAQGFDYYDEVFINVKKDIQFFLIFQVIDLFFPLHDLCAQYGYLGKRIASQVNESAFEWLDKNYRQPFFLFINYFDPHVPYFPPPPYDKYFGEVKTDMILLRNHKGESGFVNLEENLIMATLEGRHKLTHDERELLVSQYDGEIRYLDHCLGLLFEKLKALKVYDNTLIVVTSDHGEAFGEHGLIEHGLSLYEEVLRVPLIIKYPSASLRREVVEKRISLVDLLSIILSFLDYSLPLGIDGKNVESLECPVIAETYAMLWSTDRFNRDIKTVYQGEYKYIWSSNKLDELYDLKKDPSEEVNLIARYPLGAQSMKKILEQWLASFKRAGVKREKAYINKSTEERLRSLNYVK